LRNDPFWSAGTEFPTASDDLLAKPGTTCDNHNTSMGFRQTCWISWFKKKLLKIGTMLDRTSDAVKQRKHPEKCPYLSYQWVKPQFFDGSIPIPAGFMQKYSLHLFIQNPSPSFWRFSASCRSASRGVLGNSRRGRLGKNGGVVGQLVKSYGNIPDVLN
jgi:hypothetical protein